jgi:hypothetical protein
VVYFRDAGAEVRETDAQGPLERDVVRPLSTFETITFHPKCNDPVRPEALLATDGSL